MVEKEGIRRIWRVRATVYIRGFETLGGRREEERVPCCVEENLDMNWAGRMPKVSMVPKQQGLGWRSSSLPLNNDEYLLHTAAVVTQDFTFLTQVLGVLLTLVRHIQAIWFL